MANKKYYVYKHTFPNNKVYIGITCQEPEMRWGDHGEGYMRLNKKGQPTQAKMYYAIKKYGWDNVQHEIIKIVYSKKDAEKQERYYITKVYKSHFEKYGYNIMRGGSYKGALTAKIKQKISDSVKLAYQTSESLILSRFYIKIRRSWTNGKQNKLCANQPGKEWWPGRKLQYITEMYPPLTKARLLKKFKKYKKYK